MIEKIRRLALKFAELTGNPAIESYLMQGEARQFLNSGFTEDDLALMVRYRKATVKDASILKAMLRWRFIIGDVQRFAEDLPEAKAYFRKNRPATDRERVLQSTGRVNPETGAKFGGITPKQVLSAAGQKAFEDFKAFRRTLE